MGTRRDQYRRQRMLLAGLHNAVGVLFDSNNRRSPLEVETLERILKYVTELLRMQKLNDERRKALARIFQECSGGDGYVVLNKNVLSLQGDYAIDELAKRIVWGGPLSESNIIEGE